MLYIPSVLPIWVEAITVISSTDGSLKASIIPLRYGVLTVRQRPDSALVIGCRILKSSAHWLTSISRGGSQACFCFSLQIVLCSFLIFNIILRRILSFRKLQENLFYPFP